MEMADDIIIGVPDADLIIVYNAGESYVYLANCQSFDDVDLNSIALNGLDGFKIFGYESEGHAAIQLVVPAM